MKAFHEEIQPVETTSKPDLHAVPPAIEVAPSVSMTPGRALSFEEAQASSLAENAELYRRLAK